MTTEMPGPVPDGRRAHFTRRQVLAGGGALAMTVFTWGCGSSQPVAIAIRDDEAAAAKFLSDAERTCLRALVDRFVPGPPEDVDPGAAEAGCAEAIDALLGAFLTDPPRIYAGAPFSDRGGAPDNGFARFLALDAYETLAWRLRIEGSAAQPQAAAHLGEFKGLQQVYREGLAALDAAARAQGAADFAALDRLQREVLLRLASAPAIKALIDVAFPHTLEFMYGAPEYGGNRERAAWRYTRFDGDVQPRGYTREQVETADNPGLQDGLDLPLSIPLEQLLALAPLASPELAHGLMQQSDGSFEAMQKRIVAALVAGGSHGA